MNKVELELWTSLKALLAALMLLAIGYAAFVILWAVRPPPAPQAPQNLSIKMQPADFGVVCESFVSPSRLDRCNIIRVVCFDGETHRVISTSHAC